MLADTAIFDHAWSEELIKNIGQVTVGGTPSTSVEKYWGGEIPWMSSGDVHLKRVHDVPGRISELGLRSSNATFVDPPAVAIGLAGQGKTRGTVALVLTPLCTNQSVALIQGKEGKLDIFYLFYNLEFRYQELRSRSAGGGRAGLSKGILERLPITLPNISDQRAISLVLSTIDRAIEQTEAIIAKQQRIKTGLMQDLLTKGIDENGNVRSEATHQFKDSPLGRIPIEWDAKSLDKIASHIIDCPHTTPSFTEGGVLVARTFNISDGVFSLENASFINETEYGGRVSRLEPRPDDLIFTREAPVGEVFVIPEGMRVCLGQRTMLIRCNETFLSPSYLLESLYSEEMRIRFDRMVGGTTNPHLNVADVRSLLIKQPKPQEQILIANILAEIRLSLCAAQEHKLKLQLSKTGLMQDLLTGNVRVTALLNDPKTANI